MSSAKRFETHLEITDPAISLLAQLSAASGLSHKALKNAAHNGALWLAQGNSRPRRIRRLKRPLRAGDQLHLYFDPKIQSQAVPDARLIFDAGDYSVWDKPGGMFVQPSKWGDQCAIGRYAQRHLEPERPSYIVHRLDRATQGLILLAHRKPVVQAFTRLFERAEIDKRYRAMVAGRLPDGGSPLSLDTELEGRRAHSQLRELSYDDQRQTSLLEIRIATGRKHQVRRHLAAIGLPVIGDRLYGDPVQEQALMLQAAELRFVCPLTGAPRQFRAHALLNPDGTSPSPNVSKP